MAATEKIGTTELSTYGLRLASLQGNLDLPPFKDILDEHDYEANLLKLEGQEVKIKLFGFYTSRANLGTNINNFKTKIQSAIKQVWTFTNHSFEETCVVKDGMRVKVHGTSAEVDLTLTITEA